MDEKVLLKFIRENPNLKAREIAKRIGATRGEINSILHDHTDLFIKDDDFRWSIREDEIYVRFADNTWVDSDSFESTLKKTGCLLSSPYKSITLMGRQGRCLLFFY